MAEEKTELTYGQATEEIERILAAIEDESEVDIDALADRVERASELIRFCFDRLKTAEVRVRKVTDELARATGEEEAGD